MKNIKKPILIGIIVCILSLSKTFAHDCNILVTEENKTKIDDNIASIVNVYDKSFINVLPPEAYKQALIHLKAYCCAQEIPTSCSKQDKENSAEYYPQSAFFFDHLLDIAMRRLDGEKKLSYGIEPDPTGKERRQKITEIANSPNGMPANSIESTYTGYRTLHTYDNLDIVISKYNENIATVSLGDKYNTLCEIIKKIYEDVANTNKYIISKNTMKSCKNMIKERTNREVGYTKILMVQKSNQLFDQATKAYTKKYFVEERLMALWNLIAKVKDIFQTIVQQAPASKSCSK